MISTNQLFTQFGGGREGWWDEPEWLAVLKVLAEHAGEAYTPSQNPELFEDLIQALQAVGSSLNPRGQDDLRSVFRASASAWTETGVAEFRQAISITEHGRSVLAGARTYSDCLRNMFTQYRERRNGKNPFRPVLQTLSDGKSHSLDSLFESVQREIGEEMVHWIETSKVQGFPFCISPNTGNPWRSVRHMMRLVTYAGLADGDENSGWSSPDLPGLRTVLQDLELQHTPNNVTPTGGASRLETSVVIEEIIGRGWQFAPWQIAAFCQAVRTKPFVVLAGISGTGKTKLPRLIAEATGASHSVIPVRPDWRDSSDLMGYTDLTGRFHAGPLLRAAKNAIQNPAIQHFVLLDEMNLARVEYYFAEVLSLMEERRPDGSGSSRTDPLLSSAIAVRAEDNEDGIQWNDVYLPSNLALLGSVNMDETTHPFSRKVLDRAFVIEFSEVDLGVIGENAGSVDEVLPLDAAAWRPTAHRLAEHPDAQSQEVRTLIEELVSVNDILRTAQLQVGYRLRDEVALFVLNLQDDPHFVDNSANPVDPIDLAICMKILPRVQGGGFKTRELLSRLAEWAGPKDLPRMPICAARIQLLVDRFDSEGFTSFWL